MSLRNVPVLLLLVLLADSRTSGDERTAQPSEKPNGLRVKLLTANGCDGTRTPGPFIAGDVVITQIRVDGLAADSNGKLDFSCRLDLIDEHGDSIRSVPWQRINFAAGLGGDTFIFSSQLSLPADLSTGRRSVRVSIKDELVGKVTTDELAIPVLDRAAFGASNCMLAMDLSGMQPTPGIFFAGQNGYLHFQFCGFTQSKDDMHVEATLTILDEDARPLNINPIRLSGKTEALERVRDGRLPATVHFGLNRPGRFVLRLTAEDVPTGSTSARDIPIQVIELTDRQAEGMAGKRSPVSR